MGRGREVVMACPCCLGLTDSRETDPRCARCRTTCGPGLSNLCRVRGSLTVWLPGVATITWPVKVAR